MLWRVTSQLAHLQKITHFFQDRLLIFSHSLIKAWQSVLALLLFFSLHLPNKSHIRDAFDLRLKQVCGNRTGRSCQSIQLPRPVWSDLSVNPRHHTVHITWVAFHLFTLQIFLAASLVTCILWMKTCELSVNKHPSLSNACWLNCEHETENVILKPPVRYKKSPSLQEWFL